LICCAELAADRPHHAARIIEPMAARFRPGKETLQDWNWLLVQAMPALYRGDPVEAWYSAAEQRASLLESFQGRSIQLGHLECIAAGTAALVARRVTEPRERKKLLRVAQRLAKRARRATTTHFADIAVALCACWRGDRDSAIAALRRSIARANGPMSAEPVRRRLGELVGGEEGAALIAEADAFLRAGGILRPERFVAALHPGLELPEPPAPAS
jgi:hypothetical protein